MRPRSLLAIGVGLTFALSSLAFGAEPPPLEEKPPEAFTRGAESFDELGNREELLYGFVVTNGIPTRFNMQFGRTRAYGRRAYKFEDPFVFNGDSPETVEVVAGHLRPDTTYHYRLVVWNRAGRSIGEDRTFHTRPRKPGRRS